jgi:hypothetical protein
MLLQAIPITGANQLIDSAINVKYGDGSGYTFAILLLSVIVLFLLSAVVILFKNSQTTKDNYISLAEKSIISYSEFSLKIEKQNNEIEDIKDNVKESTVQYKKIYESNIELKNLVDIRISELKQIVMNYINR